MRFNSCNNDESIVAYSNASEYLQGALERLELLLQRAVLHFRQKNPVNPDNIPSWQGITDAEVDQILFKEYLNIKEEDPLEYNAKIAFLDQQIEIQKQHMLQRLQKNQEENKPIPITILQKFLNLSLIEIDVLILCLAPALDTRYTRIYAYLQDNINKIYPSIALVFALFAPSTEQRIALKAYFTNSATLSNWQLIQNLEGGSIDWDNVNYQPFKLASDVSRFLLKGLVSTATDALSYENSNLLPDTIQSLIIPLALKDQLQKLIPYLKKNIFHTQNAIFYFYGKDQKFLDYIATIFFKELTFLQHTLDAQILIQYMHIHGVDKACDYVTFLIRKALFSNAQALIIQNADLLFAEEAGVCWLTKHLLTQSTAVFGFIAFIGDAISKFKDFFAKSYNYIAQCYTFYNPLPSYELRYQLWQKVLQEAHISYTQEQIQALANTFHFSHTQIEEILQAAIQENLGDTTKINPEVLTAYCKEQNKGKLTALTSLQNSQQSLEDIILPSKPLSQLKEICTFKKYHQQVYHHWDFAQKMHIREGIVALFHGASGTGKTMAARIIAHELNLELYRIDLALMVSKYIGETEKNLSQVFDAARELDVILFFDEADTLFGKRTTIQDSHDRYANIETGYLLQRLEEYPGIVILATNLSQNIDEAFLRRFHFIVEFPFPDTEQRKRIWQAIFPKQVPIEKEIDYDFLAEKLKLAGGNISNIALHAAFLAAHKGKAISMQDILEAARDEYAKLGKLFIAADFKPYLVTEADNVKRIYTTCKS